MFNNFYMVKTLGRALVRQYDLRNSRQGDASTGDDVPMTSAPYQKLFYFSKALIHSKKFLKNSWLFMVDIYNSVNFFRNFGANGLLGKNTLKTKKSLFSDDHTGEQGLVPRFVLYRSYST